MAPNHLGVVVAATLVLGLLLGVVNTDMTEAAMEATALPRHVASSSYSGVRFLGAALAPTLTGPLSHAGGLALPYLVGAITLVVAIVCLVGGARTARPHETATEEAAIIAEGA